MQIKQVYDLVNQATKQIIGETVILTEDLTNVIDLGTAIFDSNAVDAYVKSLINHIGKVVFVNRAYKGSAPSLMMESWEYGSIKEKISCNTLLEAEENESWQLSDKTSYDPNIFRQPKVEVKFYNNKTTLQIPLSITTMQVKQSFSSADQLNAFVSMLYNEVEKSMTVKMDELIMNTITNAIGEVLYDEYQGGDTTAKSGVRAVNLLKLYNDKYSKSLTAADSILDKDFLRFASYTIAMYKKRIAKISTLYNVGKTPKFTPDDKLHIVMLADFEEGANVYLQSDVWHNNLTALPTSESVVCWQGVGTSSNFADVSKINVKTSAGNTVEQSGVLAVMFDHEAMGVSNLERRTTTNFNPAAEFYNNWFKFDCSYFNDMNENVVVFFVA